MGGTAEAAGEPRFGPHATAVEIAPDVFAIGGWVRLGPEVPWVPAPASGYDPCFGYLLRGRSQSLLIDTGLIVHRAGVLARLRELLPAGDHHLSIIMTRHEPDCFGNLGAVLSELPADCVYGFGQNPVEFFIADQARFARPAAEYFSLQRLGAELQVGGRHLSLFPAAMGSLRTAWPYDHGSGVLFCSDLFGWHHLSRPDGPLVLDPPQPPPDPEAVERFMLAKFEWLPRARTERVMGALDRVFGGHAVRILAPTHGLILRGEALVAAETAAVRDAVHRIVARSRRPA